MTAPLLRFRAQLVDLGAVALDLLGAVEKLEDAVAASDGEPRPREVVARVRLHEAAGSTERRDRALEQREGRLCIACP